MIWIPLSLMVATLFLAGVRSLGAAPDDDQRDTRGLALLFAAAAVWVAVEVFATTDLKALAQGVQDRALALAAAHPGWLTFGLGALGATLAFAGLGGAAGRAMRGDAEGPMVSLTAPLLAAGAGAVLLLGALARV
jgi:hypothetical protein